MASGCASHKRVLPSMSVNRKVNVPVGSGAVGTKRRARGIGQGSWPIARVAASPTPLGLLRHYQGLHHDVLVRRSDPRVTAEIRPRGVRKAAGSDRYLGVITHERSVRELNVRIRALGGKTGLCYEVVAARLRRIIHADGVHGR